MIGHSRLLIFSCAAALLLAACASHPQRQEHAAPPTGAASRQTRSVPVIPRNAPEPATSAGRAPAPNGMVGVASCDQYLSTYKICHRAAGIFAPDRVEAQYEMMRDGLLRDARDPVKRATLDQRCHALYRDEQQALHGKSCDSVPASSASGGTP